MTNIITCPRCSGSGKPTEKDGLVYTCACGHCGQCGGSGTVDLDKMNREEAEYHEFMEKLRKEL